jgi:hypothetical protein
VYQRAARDQPLPIASFPHAQIVWVKQHFTLSRGHYHWQPTAVALWSHRQVAPLTDSPGPQEKEGLQPPLSACPNPRAAGYRCGAPPL